MRDIAQVTVVGLGLIGGSFALALKDCGLVQELVGVDLEQHNIDLALKMHAIDWGTTDARKGVENADLIILATPVGQMVALAKAIEPSIKKGAIITDVGSCKFQLVDALEKIFGIEKHYIGGHPMAGSEQAGIAAANRFLFENAVYVLTPTASTNSQALAVLEELILSTGARVLKLDPGQHDLIVAAVSHLPHLLAVNLVNTAGQLAKQEPLTLLLAAGGFRDTTRIAMGNAIMWRDICLANKAMLKSMLGSFKEQLARLEQAIEQENQADLLELFQNARELRSRIPVKAKGLLPNLFEVVVTVPDKPGMIAEIARLLAAESINITDIEILRVREAEGGTIRIGFTTEEELSLAMQVLRNHNYVARQR